MLMLRYLLIWGGFGMMFVAAGLLAYDVYREIQYRNLVAKAGPEPLPPMPTVRWRGAVALALLAWAPLLVGIGIAVVPSGMAGVRVSQSSGTLPGTLYPGVHFVTPLVETWHFSTRATSYSLLARWKTKPQREQPRRMNL